MRPLHPTARLSALFVTAWLATAPSAPAQNHVSYPHDATTGTNGNNIAFGISVGSSLDEGRYQLLIPSRYLPSTTAVFLGMQVLPVGLTNHTLTFQSLQITLSHDTRTALDQTAANNLPSPQVVLGPGPFSANYTRRQWAPITFAAPFVYDGQSDLVIDVQKVYDRNVNPIPPGGSSMQTEGNPGRPDLPRARWEFGALGSGAATATATRFSGEPLFVRLDVGSLPTLVLRGDADGSGGNFYALGRSFDVELQAVAGATFATIAGFAFQSPPLPFPPLGGTLQVAAPVVFEFGLIGPTNVDTTSIAIPTTASFAGLQLVWQGAAVPPATTTPLWTCAGDMFINP